MRRSDREITDRAEIDAVLAEAQVLRLGLADRDGPYVVPVCFGYDEESLYIHSAPEGRKITMLEQDPRCCFEADISDGIIRGGTPCSWGVRYRSVIGYGTAVILRDPKEKQRGLDAIVRHYGGETILFSDRNMENVLVIRIRIESMTGKKHG